MKTYRVAVIGCGAISENHIKGILASGQELVALCDTEPEHANQKIAQFALTGVKVYSDYLRLLTEEKPDAVHICTPHYLHAPMAVEALSRGINVLCEKPLCISMEQLNAILRAERDSSAMLGVCLQNRYEPMMKRTKALAGEGKSVSTAFGSVVWSRDEAYYRSGEWRGKWATEGGGVMINQALHTLDLLQWFCGMPTTVSAHTSNEHLKGIIEVEDTASAVFTCPEGHTIHFFATTAASANFPVQVNLKMKDGTVLTAENDWMMREGGALTTAERESVPGKREWGVGHGELIADYYRCLSEGKKFPIDGQEGGKVIRMILAIYASDGNTVAIPEVAL